MSGETAAAAVDFIAGFARAQGAPSADIGFFGREPLTRYDLIETIVPMALQKIPSATFSLNTNGTLLTPERLSFFAGIGARIAISIDGLPDYHDLVRPACDGSPSYGLIAPMLPALAAYEPAVYVRMTVTAAGARHFCNNAVHIFDLGFKKLGFAFDLTDPHWDPQALDVLQRSMEVFAAWYAAVVAGGRDIAVPAFDSLARGRRVPDLGLFCGAAKNLFSVDCDGAVYPCWRFVGSAADAMGDVRGGWKTPPGSHPFNSVDQPRAVDCARCAHAGYCGRCAWASMRHTGSHDRVSRLQCETALIAIEAGIRACDMLAASQSPLFIGRLRETASVDAKNGTMVIADDAGCVYSIPADELEKYRVT
jgi:radical SAM protein with 4Fe4S-binding SPASM domain